MKLAIAFLIRIPSTFFFFKQKTAYEIVSRDWSSDVCSSDLVGPRPHRRPALADEDGPGQDPLPVAALHAEPPARAVAAVPRATYSLFVRHVSIPLGLLDGGSRSRRGRGDFFKALLGGCRCPGPVPPSREDDVGDAESRQPLPMAGLAAVPYLGLEAEDNELLAALPLHHLGLHGRAGQSGAPDLGRGAIATDHQDPVQ